MTMITNIIPIKQVPTFVIFHQNIYDNDHYQPFVRNFGYHIQWFLTIIRFVKNQGSEKSKANQFDEWYGIEVKGRAVRREKGGGVGGQWKMYRARSWEAREMKQGGTERPVADPAHDLHDPLFSAISHFSFSATLRTRCTRIVTRHSFTIWPWLCFNFLRSSEHIQKCAALRIHIFVFLCFVNSTREHDVKFCVNFM